jgi:hypothetical protein
VLLERGRALREECYRKARRVEILSSELDFAACPYGQKVKNERYKVRLVNST